jgi:thiol:disulfide interchange protein DsbD
MSLARILLSLSTLLSLAVVPAGAQSVDAAHTRASLKAEASSLLPGSTVTLGVLLRMDPGWHTYWVNAGEAGLPTYIAWSLPDGFAAGEIQWPLPYKFVEAGDVMTLGYKDETMLIVPVTVPGNLRPGQTVTLTADVSWLECGNICVPGSAVVSLTLPVGDAQRDPATAPLFDRYRNRIPARINDVRDLSVSSREATEAVVLALEPASNVALSQETVDFYPESGGPLTVGRTIVSGGGRTITVPVSAARRPDGPLVLRGVVVYRNAGGERVGAAVRIPLSASSFGGVGGSASGQGILGKTFTTIEQPGSNQPLLLYLVFAVVGGLLLNIMPCVLPVIALKIFGLMKMSGNEPNKVKRLGWTFSAGILFSFLVLALIVILLQFAGSQVGWGFQFQEPLFVVAMAAVVFAFGLSLFGVYEIQLPGAALAGVGSLAAKQEKGGAGYAASFWEGVFATILATPCTAPFLGSALGFAFAQPPLVILLIFAAVAFGMALPYLLITSRPAWLKYLPKPGAWMETAKQFMGFLMMATVLWLLYILGKQLGVEAVVWTGAFLLSIAVGAWLVGRFATLTATRARAYAIWALALLIVAGAYVLFMESALNVRALIAGEKAVEESGQEQAAGHIPWQRFTLTALERELGDGRPVFIDFTAEWCLTCKVNERTVLADREVVDAFAASGIVPFKADWTNRNPEITQLLRKFGRSGVPLYVVFPAGRPDAPIVLPEVITSSIIIDALKNATGVK